MNLSFPMIQVMRLLDRSMSDCLTVDPADGVTLVPMEPEVADFVRLYPVECDPRLLSFDDRWRIRLEVFGSSAQCGVVLRGDVIRAVAQQHEQHDVPGARRYIQVCLGADDVSVMPGVVWRTPSAASGAPIHPIDAPAAGAEVARWRGES